MLDNIKIKGFRSLKDVSIPLRNLNVIIGPNGSGKTAFLDIFLLLCEAARGHLQDGIFARGGLEAILCKKGCGYLEIEISYSRSQEIIEVDYYIKLSQRIRTAEIIREVLAERVSPNRPNPFVHINSNEGDVQYFSKLQADKEKPAKGYIYEETALSQIPQIAMYYEPNEFRLALSQTAFYSGLDVSPRAPLRLPQELRPVKLPGPNGEYLFSTLYNLSQENEPTYKVIIDSLKAAFPGFDHLTFPLVGAGQTTLAWHDSNFKEPFYPSQLSEGSLRFLWLATILLSPDLPPITLIDEPEVSMHPELIHHLASLLQDASMRTQLIVATHSDRLIRWLKPENVLVADKEDGVTTLTWADTMDLEKWLKEYTLDQLWLMGEMGGRP